MAKRTDPHVSLDRLAGRQTDGNARYTKLTDEQKDRRTDNRTEWVPQQLRSAQPDRNCMPGIMTSFARNISTKLYVYPDNDD